MTQPGRDPRFQTTQWSLVRQAAQPESGREALETLCHTYWYPLYCYARRRGADADEAQDLTQDFFAQLVAGDLLSGVDPQRGRFRTFLLTCFRNFAANQQRRHATLKRGGNFTRLPLDYALAESRYLAQREEQLPPDALYLRSWALTVIERAFARLRQQAYLQPEREPLFETLRRQLWGQLEAAQAARELGLSDTAFRAAAYRFRRKFRDALRDEVAQTMDPGDDIDQELRELMAAARGETTS